MKHLELISPLLQYEQTRAFTLSQAISSFMLILSTESLTKIWTKSQLLQSCFLGLRSPQLVRGLHYFQLSDTHQRSIGRLAEERVRSRPTNPSRVVELLGTNPFITIKGAEALAIRAYDCETRHRATNVHVWQKRVEM